MNKNIALSIILPLLATMPLAGTAQAANWQETLKAAAAANGISEGQATQTLNNAKQLLQNKNQHTGVAQAIQPGSNLTDLLIKRTGVSQAQAQGGVGALMQVAKSRMQADAFTRLGQSVPGLQGIMAAAPALQQPSALGGLAGKLAAVPGVSGGTVGNLLSVASAFQQQGMSPTMIQQFIPVLVDYVKANAGNGLSSALSAALIGQ